MINAIDNGQLITDLDAQGFSVLNIAAVIPPPANLITEADPRLSDRRAPLDESVSNASVAANAQIDQSKLNLNGVIPPEWLGFDSTHAAQGDLVEYFSNRGIPNGYASLDGTGKVPLLQLPAEIGTGTVTSVGLAMPVEFTVAGSPVTTAGTLAVNWANAPAESWFGNPSNVSAVPGFNTVPIPVITVPGLPASKIVTGTIDPARIPAAVGVGAGHAPGGVPDPGSIGSPDDYLARDMTYKPPPTIGASYQPLVPSPVLQPDSVGADVVVTISDVLPGASLFYKITGMAAYEEAPSSVHVLTGQTLDVYGSKAGYTNSNIVFYVNP